MTTPIILDDWVIAKTEDERERRRKIFADLQKHGQPIWFQHFKYDNYFYLSLLHYEDMLHVSRNPNRYINATGFLINDNESFLPFNGSLLTMDGAKHRDYRAIVSNAFRRAEVENMREDIRTGIRAIFEKLILEHPDRTADVYAKLALQIPVFVNCQMLGVPLEDAPKIDVFTKRIVLGDDEEHGNGNPISWYKACVKLRQYGAKLADARRQDPKDDLITSLISAEINGEPMSDEEFGHYFILMLVAGLETTTHSLIHLLRHLTDNPEEKSAVLSSPQKYAIPAIEESLRLEPPVMYTRRTATEDDEIGGVSVRAGDRIVIWHTATNRDESVFPEPNKFDLERVTTQHHTSFGGPGPHHCVGATLARVEAEEFIYALAEYTPDMVVSAEQPVYGRSLWGNGVNRCYAKW